jgi:CRISPR-associated protein Csc3
MPNQNPNQQLELFLSQSASSDLIPDINEDFPELDLDNLDNDDFGQADSAAPSIPTEKPELLTLKLLRQAIKAQNPEDRVMEDFADLVLPQLLNIAIGETAKGGQFFDELDRQRAKAGKERVRRNNAGDQSLNTHLLNGLFPANFIYQRLQKLDNTLSRNSDELSHRLTVAGFILHDYEKFPDVPNDAKNLSIEAEKELVREKILQLNLNQFINPEDSDFYEQYLDDLLVLIRNTQRRWGTNWNFSDYGLKPQLRPRLLRQMTDLCCLADSFASIIKHPQDSVKTKFTDLMHSLSDGQLTLTYHHLTENRGVLTNIINNAVMDLYTENNADTTYYAPLLYLPTGVIYLQTCQAPIIEVQGLGNRVIKKIQSLCFRQLQARQTGFSRDGKGLKYADYYTLFCDDRGLMKIALDATLRILNASKKSVAPARTEKLEAFQALGVLSKEADFSLKNDLRMDQLAEFGDAVCRNIWGDRREKLEALVKERTQARKQDKTLPALPPVELPTTELVHKVAEFWRLTEYLPQIREIQQINESLKAQKLKGNTGGVPYEWYYLATRYLEKNPGLETIRETAEDLIEFVAGLIEPIIEQYAALDGWQDMRDWVQRVVILPQQTLASSEDQLHIFSKELNAYSAAKKQGRGKEIICSISHSAYTVTEQMESAVLFTPQVYTNKQHLGGANAKRNISSIAGIEMMLRQILMNQTQAVGKRFEDGKYRYLYFYPTYYFTPETNKFLHQAYRDIFQTRFDVSLRNHFISLKDGANFTKENYQNADLFLMDEQLNQKKALAEDDPAHKRDRTFKLAYPDDQPLTFYFMALPPGKDPTDTESWVMPAWLAFAAPIILDVKTVVSESPIPPFTDGAEFEETVFLDSAPQAFRVLTGADRFRLDSILKGWQDDQDNRHPAPLNMLTAAYAIHLDVNAKKGKGGYDPNWGKLTELAKDLETSPLYIFHYLSRWSRKQDQDAPSVQKIKLYAYHFYPCFDPHVRFENDQLHLAPLSPMNHPKELTRLYREFYRAQDFYKAKANAILKPIEEAASVLLNADYCLCDDDAIIDLVAAKVNKLMDRVHSKNAEGRPIIRDSTGKHFDREKERQKVYEFAQYFVIEVFQKGFKGDRARLAGKQLNLIRDTCEFLYRLEQDQENQKYQAAKKLAEEEEED